MQARRFAFPLAVLVVVTACAAPASPLSSDAGRSAPAVAESRTLTMADRTAPEDLAAKIPTQGMAARTKRLFNAFLALTDDQGIAHPYLAESLPQLNTDSWRVSADGRMETTYRLRPNLTWHDGRPLTADDFVFALRVYANKDINLFTLRPQDQIEDVRAPDALTVLITWRSPYPGAGVLAQGDFDPLPRHILEEPFAAVERDPTARDSFANLRFWADEYVGAGPYRLVHWERGVSIEGEAFDGHALGKPKITRVIRRFFADENAVLANVLAGEISFADVTTLRFNHGQTLQQEWVSAGRGQLLFLPSAPLAPLVQFRQEYQRSLPLLDVRVRKAMAHGIDKEGVSDALYPGVPSTRAETIISKLEPYYEQVDRAITKYPFDARKTEEYMAEAGLTKDRDGFYADVAGVRFRPDFQVLTNVDSQRMQLIVSDTWKQLGIDVQPNVLPQAQVQDNEARAKYSGLATPGSALGLERDQAMRFHTSQIGTPANRWRGANQGWVSPDYDRLFDTYDVTLDRSQQIQQITEMMKLLSEQVPVFPVYYNIYVIAVANGIRGPTVAAASTIYWNLQDWEYR